jgi:predicted RNA methylase
MQIAALFEPSIVIGVDIDPTLIKAATNNMHKVINDDECAKLVKQKMSDASKDKVD